MPLPDRDYDLLSAYLDDDLSPSERRQVELRLASDEEFRVELNALRQTVSLLQTLPDLAAPRDFTLSKAQARAINAEREAQHQINRPRIITPAFRRMAIPALSAVASLILAVIGGYSLLVPARPPAAVSAPIAMIGTEAAAGQDLTFAAEPDPVTATTEVGSLALERAMSPTNESADAMPSAALSSPPVAQAQSTPPPPSPMATQPSITEMADAAGDSDAEDADSLSNSGAAAASTMDSSVPELDVMPAPADDAQDAFSSEPGALPDQALRAEKFPDEQPAGISPLAAVGLLGMGLLLGVFALISWPRRMR